MLDWITHLMNSMGYAGVALLMFLENVFPPLPSELIMPLAGVTTTQGEMNLVSVIIAGMVGSVLGQLPLYYLGKVVGKDRLKAWADKHGALLALSGKDIEAADQWFGKHGHKAVLFGRLVPGVRSLISVPAGFAGMNLVQFLLYSAVGTGVWAALLAYGGSLLGKRYDLLNKYLGPVAYVVLGGLLIYFVVNIIKRKKARANGGADDGENKEKPAAA